MVYSWLNNIQYALLPGRCIVCTGASHRHMDLCDSCEALLTQPWPRCRHCALPCAQDSVACGNCSRQAYQFTRCEALAPYQAPIDQLITDFKFRRRLAAGRTLAQLLAKRLATHYSDDDWPDYLLPVPLHWRRQWRRGFNQSHYLALQLGRQLDLPVADKLVVRHRPTSSQQGLDRRQRLSNLKHAFRIKRPLLAAHVALIDDVMTTGTTCDVLAKLLLDQGVERVDVWCLARTPDDRGAA